MNSFYSIDDLTKEVESRIQTSMKKDLPKIAKRVLKKRAKSDVNRKSSYKIGNSTVPARPYEESIENENNMVDLVENDTFFLRAIARPRSFWPSIFPYKSSLDPYGTAFAEMINDGSWVDIGELKRRGRAQSGEAPKREARPFVTHAQEDLIADQDMILNIIKTRIEKNKSR